MFYNNTTFIKSVADLNALPSDNGAEVAFVGRSNSGKSSALNTITGIKSLAKTGKTPGRTQLINFFSVEEDKYLVDLPGYGYAKVAAHLQKQWGQRLSDYIANRSSLRGIIIIMDIRHPLKDLDWQMIEWCWQQQLKMHILLSKADKLSTNHANQTLFATQKKLQDLNGLITVQKFSALTKEGLEQAQHKLDEWFAG